MLSCTPKAIHIIDVSAKMVTRKIDLDVQLVQVHDGVLLLLTMDGELWMALTSTIQESFEINL